MNYRHAYHAGNMCDVAKHAVLALIVQYLCNKGKAFAVLDTHAGCGLYDLNDECALKTGEAKEGVHRLWNLYGDQDQATWPAELAPYLKVLSTLNPNGQMQAYPGSPFVARHLIRAQDRYIGCELHPEDIHTLRAAFRHDTQAQLHHRDGYEALKALLPFSEKRGLVLIDPPFEQPDEFERLGQTAQHITQRFPQAIVAIWYPIKERPAIWRFHDALMKSHEGKLMLAEFMFHPEVRSDRLNGTGFAIINSPWILEAQLSKLFPLLHQALKTESQAYVIKVD